jgi:alpha-L-arabinofuranosidase
VLAQLGASHEIDFILDKTDAIVQAHSDPPVPLAFDEWNTYLRAKPPLFVEDYNLADGLYTAGVMNACLRRADRVHMSAPFNFTNVMGNYRITQRAVWATPSTLVLDLFTRLRGDVAVACAVTETPTFSTPEIGQQFAYEGIPTVDAAATLDRNAGILYLSLVNHDLTETAEVHLGGIIRAGEATIYTVTGDSGVAMNDEDNLNAVVIEERGWGDDRDNLVLEMPALSFCMVCIPLK